MGMGLFRKEMLLSQGVDESFQVAATCLKAEALLGQLNLLDAVLVGPRCTQRKFISPRTL